MKKFLIVASLCGLLAACNDSVPMLSAEDGGSSYTTPEPRGVIFKDPNTGNDVFIPKDGEGIFF